MVIANKKEILTGSNKKPQFIFIFSILNQLIIVISTVDPDIISKKANIVKIEVIIKHVIVIIWLPKTPNLRPKIPAKIDPIKGKNSINKYIYY